MTDSTPRHPAEDGYTGPDDDLTSGNISDADFAHQVDHDSEPADAQAISPAPDGDAHSEG